MTDTQNRMLENIENHKEKNKSLCEKMPYLAIHNSWTGKISEEYDYSYIEADSLPRGWRELFLQMCEDLVVPLTKAGLLNEFYFTQVKEKYGTMRAYCGPATLEVYDIIRKYEYMSQFVCQDCGAPATKMTNHWVASYCNDCFNWKCWDIDEDRYEEIEFNPIYVKEICCNGVSEKTEVDCTDIWNRFYKEKK